MGITEPNAHQLVALSKEEMIATQGGESAWYWVAYGVANVIHGAWELAKEAGEYQASLPPHLKK